MNQDSSIEPDERPILIVPYMWIGDFVRCQSVAKVLRQRHPNRPIDILTTALCAPLVDYMPEIRAGIVCDLPRKRLALLDHIMLAQRLGTGGYGSALIMPRTWKAALAPWLAAIPTRTGFVGEARFVLVNDLRFGERRLPRMIDRCGALALPRGESAPKDWPLPHLEVPFGEATAWSERQRLPDDGRPVVALCPGAVGPSKRWQAAGYAELTKRLTANGIAVWVLGGPAETELAGEIVADAGPLARDLTSNNLRNAILALRLARVAVSNDSGLLHVAAATGTPSVGIFGPTSPWHWAPLNPLAATVQAVTDLPCRPCHKPTCRLKHHRCMTEISADQVMAAVEGALEAAAVPG